MISFLLGSNIRRAIFHTNVTYVECNQGIYPEAKDADEASDTGCLTKEAKYGEYRRMLGH